MIHVPLNWIIKAYALGFKLKVKVLLHCESIPDELNLSCKPSDLVVLIDILADITYIYHMSACLEMINIQL